MLTKKIQILQKILLKNKLKSNTKTNVYMQISGPY